MWGKGHGSRFWVVGCRSVGFGFRVQGFGFWVLGLGFRVQGSGSSLFDHPDPDPRAV